MKKFTLIFLALVMCVSALAVGVAAATTDCSKGNHDWTSYVTVAENDDGSIVKERKCSCGVKQTHTFEKVAEVAPNCTNTGSVAYWVCVDHEDCDLVLNTIGAIVAADEFDPTTETNGVHNWVAADPVIVECFATVTSTCSFCGETKVSDPVETHNLETVPAKDATCTELGNNEYKICKDCEMVFNATGISNIPSESFMLPHTYGEAYEVVENCVKTTSHACTVCGYVEDLSVEDAHAWVEVEETKATCTLPGLAAHKECACGALATVGGVLTNVKDLTIESAPGHTLVVTPAKAATCTEKGNNEYSVCSVCEIVLNANGAVSSIPSETIPSAEGHTWGESVEKKEECFVITTHTCTVCGATEEVSAVESHNFESVAAKDYTCEADGNNAYKICKDCKIVINANGKVSNVLNETLPAAHRLTKVEAKAPTATENGNNEYYICSCGYAETVNGKATNVKNETIPATGEHTVTPPTGDNNNAIFFVVAMVAVIALGAAAVSFKKREN